MKIPVELIGKHVKYENFLDPSMRCEGIPQYHRIISIRGYWSWGCIFDSQKKPAENIDYALANAIEDFFRYYGQIHKTTNAVGYMDSKGEMIFSAVLVNNYNRTH